MICSLAVYNRPEYLTEVIRSIRDAVNHLNEPVTFYVRVDPSPVAVEVVQLLLNGLPDPDHVNMQFNKEQLGCAANTKAVIEDAFTAGADFVFHLEDDLVLAPGAFHLAAWLRDTYRDDPEVLCVGVKSVWKTSPGDENLVRLTNWFGCHTWGTWRYEWYNDFVPRWEPLREGEVGYRGWDVTINDKIMRDYAQALPLLTRSQHIGEHGTFANGKSYPPSIAPDWDIAQDVSRTLGPYKERDRERKR